MKRTCENTLSTPLQRYKRHALTLIELFLVFALLAMVGGLLALNLRAGVASERYLNHVYELAARLQLAQQLMYVAQTDFEVTLESTPKGLEYTIRPIQTLTPFLKHLLGSNTLLDGIQHLDWRTPDGQLIEPPIKLTFFSRGALVTRGELTLTSKAKESRYILITGDGRPIQMRTTSRVDLLERTLYDAQNQAQLYPAQLRDWVNRAQHKEGG